MVLVFYKVFQCILVINKCQKLAFYYRLDARKFAGRKNVQKRHKLWAFLVINVSNTFSYLDDASNAQCRKMRRRLSLYHQVEGDCITVAQI